MSTKQFLFLCIYPIVVGISSMYLLLEPEAFIVYLKGMALFVVVMAPIVAAVAMKKPYQPPVD